MSKTRSVTAAGMRTAWKRRQAARKAMHANNKLICDYTSDERAAFDGYEQEIAETSKILLDGLRERDGEFLLAPGFRLVLDRHGDMVPLWPWMATSTDTGTANLYRRISRETAERRAA